MVGSVDRWLVSEVSVMGGTGGAVGVWAGGWTGKVEVGDETVEGGVSLWERDGMARGGV